MKNTEYRIQDTEEYTFASIADPSLRYASFEMTRRVASFEMTRRVASFEITKKGASFEMTKKEDPR